QVDEESEASADQPVDRVTVEGDRMCTENERGAADTLDVAVHGRLVPTGCGRDHGNVDAWVEPHHVHAEGRECDRSAGRVVGHVAVTSRRPLQAGDDRLLRRLVQLDGDVHGGHPVVEGGGEQLQVVVQIVGEVPVDLGHGRPHGAPDVPLGVRVPCQSGDVGRVGLECGQPVAAGQ